MEEKFEDSSLSIPCPPPPPTFTLSEVQTTTSSNDFDSSSVTGSTLNLVKNVDKISVKNCGNVGNALDVLEQSLMSNEFTAFMIKFEVTGCLNTTDKGRIIQIFQQVNRKFFIISFKNAEELEIFWKFGKSKIFTISTKIEISSFLLTFLTHSLKVDGHSGLSLDTLRILSTFEDICMLKLHSLADDRDYNLLMLAAEVGDIDAVNFLLNEGFDVNILILNKTAIDLAWDNKHYNVVHVLLNANSIYPSKFNVKEATDELKVIANHARHLHNLIKDNKFDEIKAIVKENQHFRHFYTTRNMSAATKAALCGHFDIYDLLMYYNVFIGPKEDVNAILRKLNDSHREDIRGINLKYVQNWTDKHLMILAANSFVGHDIPDVDKKLEHVTTAYDVLNKAHPLTSLILKVVAASRDFKVIFDFNRDSVQYLNPTADQHTRGIFHTSRHIYVAGKHLFDEERKYEAYGTLIHELCHYAVHLVYHNQCRPYDNNDAAMLEFSAINIMCQARQNQDILIDMVYNNYPVSLQHAELIVRVPHMIVQYSNDQERLNSCRETFSELFDFFETVTAVHMEDSLPDIEVEAIGEIQKFADRTRRQRHQIFSLWFLSSFLLMMMPVMIWMTWWMVFVPVEPIYSCGNLTDTLRLKIINSTVNFQGENVNFGDLFGRNLSSCEALTVDEIGGMIKALNIQENITKQPKNNSISNSINFLKIGTKTPQKSSIYIDRKISTVSYSNWKYNYHPIDFNDLKNSKILLLADGPGSGKSTTFRRLAIKFKNLYPLNWVSYIDMKLFITEFKEAKSYINQSKSAANFISHKILNLTSKSELEVFNKKFTSNQSIFLWDGLDEVSPYALNESLTLFSIIYSTTDNIQWISTRPSFKHNIINTFNITDYKLSPYDAQNRDEFITKFLKTSNFTSINITAAKHKIDIFMARFERQGTYSHYQKEMINSPLMLDMICKSYIKSQSLGNSTNLYSFFEFYINQLFDIVQLEKGDVVTNDTKRIERQEQFRQIHQHYAVKDMINGIFEISDIFDYNFVDGKNLGILKMQLRWTDSEVSRYGILFPDPGGMLNFDHRTFKEFFIAQYFYDNLWNLKYGHVSTQEARLRLLIFFKIVSSGESVYKVIHDFIDGFIDAYYVNEFFNEEVSYLMKYDFKDLFLSVFDDFKKIQFYTKFFKKDTEVINILWKINKNMTFFHQFFSEFRSDDVDGLADMIRMQFDENDQHKIFHGRFQKINIINILWNHKYDEKFIKTFMELTNVTIDIEAVKSIIWRYDFIDFISSHNFTASEIFEYVLDNAIVSIMMNDVLADIKKFWGLAERTLSRSEMKIVLQSKDYRKNQTLLFYMDRSDVEIPKYILKLIETYLEPNEVTDLLMQRNRLGRHTFITQKASFLSNWRTFEHVWTFVKKYLNQEQRKIMLTAYDVEHMLNLICKSVYEGSFQFFKSIFLETYSIAELQQLTFKLNAYGDSIIFSTVGSYSETVDLSTEVVGFIEEIFDGNVDGLRKLLAIRTKSLNMTVFRYYGDSRRESKLKPFLDLAKKIFTDEEFEMMLK